ncbi:hypothetical protein [Peribacillus sp. TH24]|uniref:hypothetical protein n=1 Tax=Peribacillus sp. TH24 TaxID=2798483 RepID=UPI0019142DD9|nr:hypothetical protein [Peribacillus sp. TH24]MBK5446484.1 hypothetical protein [Peribacillus sp. TH24]
MVYVYKAGFYANLGIPINFIDLGMNNLITTIIKLFLFSFVLIPVMVDVINNQTNINKIFTCIPLILLSWFTYKIQLYEYSAVSFACIVFIISLFFTKDMKIKILAFIILILLGLPGLVGYISGFDLISKKTTHYVINKGNKTFVVLDSYQDNFIVSELDKKTNKIKGEYQLIPFNSDDKPIIIKQKDFKLQIQPD